MKRIISHALISFLAVTAAWAADGASANKGGAPMAVFETTEGTFKVKLLPELAPKTVENFVGLATGTKEFTDPKTGKPTKKNFYDGLTFHRLISGFMIQGGDPLGNGRGGPGYQFEDEFDKHPGFTKKGYLAMANAGPNTNGSQFFITVVPTPHLNPKDRFNNPVNSPAFRGPAFGHTIFGEVVEGYDVVEKISKLPTDGNDAPLKPVVMKSVRIEK